jgi:excisionase family DNA binding protein
MTCPGSRPEWGRRRRASGDWLSTAEVAAALGLTATTVYRLIDQGLLPAYRLGRVIRCRRTDVDAFLDTRRITPGELHQRRDPDT